jgi:glycosyltransferase involved in cell wall biosynthesis
MRLEDERNGWLGTYDGIICFGGEDWWYHNRAHFDMQVMQCMARKLPVLYVNSIGFRMPTLKEGGAALNRIGRKLRSVAHGVQSPFPGFHVASPFSVPMWHWPYLANLNVWSLTLQVRKAARRAGLKNPLLWVACPTAVEIVKRMQRHSFLVYQRTDKFEEYSEQTREYVIAADRWLSEHADLVLYASTVLYEEERMRNAQSLLVRHGVEVAHFDPERARRVAEPADMVNIRRPIVGFFGEIESDTMDMPLLGEVARALPNVSFVFVGRVVAPPEPLRGLPNVHFLGKKPYENIPQYGVQFDVAILPWKQNWWTYYSNPIKIKEYLALGLPIVSTAFPEALHYNDVMYAAHTAKEFIQGIREAFEGRPVGTVETRRARVAEDTWERATVRIAESIQRLARQNSEVQSCEDPIAMPHGSQGFEFRGR